MSIRLFVAIEPPERVRGHLAAMQQQLRRAAGRDARQVRWVPADDLHLCLHFMGAVREKRLEELKAAMREVVEESGPLQLEAHGAGGFPNPRHASVVWAGVSGGEPALGRLVAALRGRLAPLDLAPGERDFSAHVVLGRAQYPYGVSSLSGALWRASCIPPVPWRANEVVLYRSHLLPSGPRYRALLRLTLAGVERRVLAGEA